MKNNNNCHKSTMQPLHENACLKLQEVLNAVYVDMPV